MKKPILALLSISLLPVSPPVYSETESTLHRFEADATNTKEGKQQDKETKSVNLSDVPDGVFFWIPVIIVGSIVGGGSNSWERVTSSQEAVSNADIDKTDVDTEPLPPRKSGEVLIPFARIDLSYHKPDERIHAADTRVEIGYGPIGFEIRNTHYQEQDPNAELTTKQYHLLYRMSLSEHAEIDFGYGEFEMIGVSSNSVTSWTLPIHISKNRFSFEYRPVYATIDGNDIRDVEYSISVGGQYWAVRGGYRSFENPYSALKGPFLGISARY